jgi:hypothetical protein
MPFLSKSKLIAYRQCPKRLWLEVHRPELREDSAQTQAIFEIGHRVGDLARQLYDPKNKGSFLDIQKLGVGGVIDATRELLPQRQMIFEAGFSIGTRARGALALADILRPHSDGHSWSMVEVKSSTKVHAYHEDDAAIQYHVATLAGISLKSLKLAHVDSGWIYPGGDDFQGLLVEQDLTEIAASRSGEVAKWLSDAHQIVAGAAPPMQKMGSHCGRPFACGFEAACRSEDEAKNGVPVHPVRWLPMQGARKDLKTFLNEVEPRSMLQISDELLNSRQLRVKQAHAAGKMYFDAASAAAQLRGHALPALFLDFETIMHAVPLWKGTRPYQQVPFQFSLHRLSRTGKLAHWGFLDLSGNDPSRAIAKALVEACGQGEPIFAYNSSFEGTRLAELADRFPRLGPGLRQIQGRLVDLRPVAESCFYDPSQQGSWSIKQLLPAVAPELSYAQLTGVQDGGAAADAYREAIHTSTGAKRREEIRQQLWRYCRLDTFAMVRLWAFLAGRADFVPARDECESQEVGG